MPENDTTPKDFIDVPPVVLDGTFWTLFKWARDLDLHLTRRAVLWAVLGHVDWKTGKDCKASLDTLAKESGAGRMTVIRSLQWLEGQGVILGKHTGGRYVTSYQLVRFQQSHSGTVEQEQQYQSETVNRTTESSNCTTELLQQSHSGTQTNPGSIYNQPSPISGASADAEGGEGIKNSQETGNAEAETLVKNEKVTMVAGRQILEKDRPPLNPVCPGCDTRKVLGPTGICGHCSKRGKTAPPPAAAPVVDFSEFHTYGCCVGDESEDAEECPNPEYYHGSCFDHSVTAENVAELGWDNLRAARAKYQDRPDLYNQAWIDKVDMDDARIKRNNQERKRRRLQEYEEE